MLGKILILVLIILFIQKRPQGLFALKGRVMTDEPTYYLNAGAQSAAPAALVRRAVTAGPAKYAVSGAAATHPLAVSTWLLTLTGKILCYAIVAVALDLVWGWPGCSHQPWDLFALGGYAMGMYLMRQAAGDGLPAFMSFFVVMSCRGSGGAPAFRLGYAAGGAGARLLALVFGWFAFRSKIKGVYFRL